MEASIQNPDISAAWDAPVSALLVDDNAFYRRGLRMMLLAHGIAVVGEASNGRDGVRLAAELRPDVVVMDNDMPVMNGLEATSQILALADPPAVIVMAAADSSSALDAILLGARGFLVKDAAADDIAAGVRAAADGDSVLSPSVTGRLVTRMRELEAARRRMAPQRAHAGLSERECDVLRLLAAGRGNTCIGEELYISPSTVKHHVASIIEKLGVQNRVQAAAEAVRIGLA